MIPAGGPAVSTVRGDIGVDQLGTVLSHEHIFVKNPEFHANFPDMWDPAAGVELAARQLEEAYDAGVRTVVDMTVIGQGRDPALIAAVAARTRVNIVLATGLYVLDGLPQIVRYRGPGTMVEQPDPIVDLLEREVREGIAGTGARAELVKFACEHPEPDDTVRRVAAAVAEVYRRTGVPVVAHIEPALPNALPVLELLADLGVPPTQVVLAHAGDITDPGYLAAVAESGAYIGCDRFGLAPFVPEDTRLATVLALLEAGRGDQALLSHDCPSFIDHQPVELRAAIAPDWTLTHLHRSVLPALRRRGVTDEQIDVLMRVNPARLLTSAHVAREVVDVAG
jgi:phosphotriesterase-related protein